jgi:outer membrane protein TolC
MKPFKNNPSSLFIQLWNSVSLDYSIKWIFTGALFLAFCNSQAQKSPASVLRIDTSSAIEEKLVALALQGPEIKNVEHQSKIDEYKLKAAQDAWLNLLTFSINYNDQSFAKNQTTAYVYPKYFVGVTVPLGTIFSKTQVKSAREGIEIGKNNEELAKRKIREDVLTAYRQYRAYSELITIQSELVNDVQAELAQNEEKFRKGTITIEAYNAAQKSSNTELAALINLRLQQDLKKIEIEKMIGVKLETVVNK